MRARRELRLGPHPLGWALRVAASTVHAILRRNACSRLTPRSIRGEVVRYERERPGELLHVECKKLGRARGATTCSSNGSSAAERWRIKDGAV